MDVLCKINVPIILESFLIELAAWRHAAIKAWGHSELGAQSGPKSQPSCHNGCHDKHNCLRWDSILGSLTMKADIPLDPLIMHTPHVFVRKH